MLAFAFRVTKYFMIERGVEQTGLRSIKGRLRFGGRAVVDSEVRHGGTNQNRIAFLGIGEKWFNKYSKAFLPGIAIKIIDFCLSSFVVPKVSEANVRISSIGHRNFFDERLFEIIAANERSVLSFVRKIFSEKQLTP